MGRTEEYRRFAEECLAISATTESAEVRATLLKMAQIWLRLADEHKNPAPHSTNNAGQKPQD